MAYVYFFTGNVEYSLIVYCQYVHIGSLADSDPVR